MYVFIHLLMCVTSPGQTKNVTDMKFGTYTPIDLIQKRVFCFFYQITVTAASLEKLPCYVDFSAYLLDCLVQILVQHFHVWVNSFSLPWKCSVGDLCCKMGNFLTACALSAIASINFPCHLIFHISPRYICFPLFLKLKKHRHTSYGSSGEINELDMSYWLLITIFIVEIIVTLVVTRCFYNSFAILFVWEGFVGL